MAKQPVNYTELTQELQTILQKLQDTDVVIDDAIRLHARGQEIIVLLEKYLKTAENTVSNVTSAAE